MNFSIDLDKISFEESEKYLSEIVKSNNYGSDIIEYLKKISFSENKGVEAKKINRIKHKETTNYLNHLIIENDGPLNFTKNNLTFQCSFLVGQEPKLYMLPYMLFAKSAGASLTIWLDDIIARFKYNRTKEVQTKINNLYRETLKHFDARIVFSSEHFSKYIIPHWILNNFNSLEFDEFIEILPYHKRDIHYIKLFDIIHFLWECVVFSQCDGDYFLTSINTKTQMRLIKKVCSEKRNIVYVSKDEYSNNSIYLFGKDKNIFNYLNNDSIEYYYKFLNPAFFNETHLEINEKRKILNCFLNEKIS